VGKYKHDTAQTHCLPNKKSGSKYDSVDICRLIVVTVAASLFLPNSKG